MLAISLICVFLFNIWSAHDLQIAATAINYGYALLTNNRHDFQMIPGLIVESPF